MTQATTDQREIETSVAMSEDHVFLQIDEDAWQEAFERWRKGAATIEDLTTGDRDHQEEICDGFALHFKFTLDCTPIAIMAQGKAYPVACGQRGETHVAAATLLLYPASPELDHQLRSAIRAGAGQED